MSRDDEHPDNPCREESLVSGRAADAATRRWLEDLDETSSRRPQALAELHELVVRVAHAELARRRGRHPLSGPELEDLAHQAGDDAMVAIIAKLREFRGESRFTTWAYRFVVLEVSSKLGRHFWQRPAASLDNGGWDRLPDRFGIDPEDHAAHSELMEALRHAVRDELTRHQQDVFTALVVDQVPLDALVCRLGSNRNAIYKTMFDARRKLRAALVANGYIDTASPAGRSKEGRKVTPS